LATLQRARQFLFVLLLGAAACCVQAASGADVPPSVSPPPLRYGVLASFPPMQVWPERSPPGGADVELVQQVALAAGIVIEPVRYTDFEALQADLLAGRIHLASSMARTTARDQALVFSRSYVQLPLALVTRADAPSAALLPDLAGRSVAVVRGYASTEQADRLFPLASRVVVNSPLEGLLAVRDGRADTLLESQPVLADLIERERIRGLTIARRVQAPSGRLHLAFHPSRAAAAERLSALLAEQDASRVEALVQAWSARAPQAATERVELSDADHERLAHWGRPVIGVVGQEPPFAARGTTGQAVGLSVDLLGSVLRQLGVEPGGWVFVEPAELRAALEQRRVDLVIGADEASDRTPLLRFVGPFIEYPTIIIARPDSGAFDLDQLQGRRLALPAGSPARPLVDSRHPGITVVECTDMAACIDTVAEGRADATLGDVVSAGLALAPRPQLQIIGNEPRLRRYHSLALADRHADLVPLVDRALVVVQNNELAALKTRWLAAQPGREFLQTLLWRYGPWMLGALVVLAGLWIWHSRRLRAEVKRTQAARADAEQAARAKSRFTSFLAHELRNSLHAVSAGTQLAQLPNQGGLDVPHMLAESAAHALHLLNTLVDRERLDAGQIKLHPSPARLSALVQAVVQELRPSALVQHQVVQVALELPEPEPQLLLDSLRVQQVLRHLLSNAIRHAKAGPVLVRAGLRAGTAQEGASGATHEAWFEVLDRGPGLPGAAEAENSYADNGLGLPLSHDLTRLMGGRLALQPRPGGGLAAAWCAPAETVPEVAATADQRQVLVVEDDELFNLRLAVALHQRGHEVQAAGSVAAARQVLLSQPVELMLSDVNLPDGHAGALLDLVQTLPLERRPRVVLMSADVQHATSLLARSLGSYTVLAKDNVNTLLEQALGTVPA
jgi:two-component system, NarL family, sensor histidine kinase EvgS